MVDEVGAPRYSYTAVSQILSEDGPRWDDTVTGDLNKPRSSRREEALIVGAEMLEPPHVGCYNWVHFRRPLCSWIARPASERSEDESKATLGRNATRIVNPEGHCAVVPGHPNRQPWWIGWET